MVILFVKSKEGNKQKVSGIHYKPHLLKTIDKERAIEVDQVPQVPHEKSKYNHVLYVNPQTKEMWYEYTLTDQQVINKEVKEENEMLKAMIADVGLQIGGGL